MGCLGISNRSTTLPPSLTTGPFIVQQPRPCMYIQTQSSRHRHRRSTTIGQQLTVATPKTPAQARPFTSLDASRRRPGSSLTRAVGRAGGRQRSVSLRTGRGRAVGGCGDGCCGGWKKGCERADGGGRKRVGGTPTAGGMNQPTLSGGGIYIPCGNRSRDDRGSSACSRPLQSALQAMSPPPARASVYGGPRGGILSRGQHYRKRLTQRDRVTVKVRGRVCDIQGARCASICFMRRSEAFTINAVGHTALQKRRFNYQMHDRALLISLSESAQD